MCHNQIPLRVGLKQFFCILDNILLFIISSAFKKIRQKYVCKHDVILMFAFWGEQSASFLYIVLLSKIILAVRHKTKK